MGEVTTEWMVLDDGSRIRAIFRDGIPVLLPNAWLKQVVRDSFSPNTPRTYAQRLVILYRWMEQEGLDVTRLTVKDLRSFRDALELGPEEPAYLFKGIEVRDCDRQQ